MTKVSDLTALTGAGVDGAADLIPIVDMSLAGSARNKKILVNELKEAIAPGTAAALDIDIDDTLAANSDALIPTQQAVKAYVDASAGGVDIEDEGTPEATATTINFVGSGVAAVDAGGGVVDVTIPGGISTFALGDATDVDTTGQATNDVLVFDGAEWVPLSIDELRPTAIFEDQKAANTAGGASTSGSFIVRVLNTTIHNDIPSVSLASNQISLPAGTYEIDALTDFFGSDACRARIQDVTNTVTLLLSDNQHSPNAAGASQVSCKMLGKFTLAGTCLIELQYRVATSRATNGLGVLSNFGVVEVYSRVKVTKLA